jgi:hypothetical protein
MLVAGTVVINSAGAYSGNSHSVFADSKAVSNAHGSQSLHYQPQADYFRPAAYRSAGCVGSADEWSEKMACLRSSGAAEEADG